MTSIANRLMALSRHTTPSVLAIRALAEEVRIVEAERDRLKQEVDLLIRVQVVKAEKVSKS